MKTKLILPFAFVVMLSLALLPTQTGCSIFGGGSSTNSFNATKAAADINMLLGPVVVLVENLEPDSIKPFQDASAALGEMLSNNASDLATLQKALSSISSNPYVSFAIGLAVKAYSPYLADAVTAGLNQNAVATILIRDGFKAALDQGIQANKARLKAHRKAVRMQ